MNEDEIPESGSLADRIWLVASSSVDLVDSEGAEDVGSGEDERQLAIESSVVSLRANWEWAFEAALRRRGW